ARDDAFLSAVASAKRTGSVKALTQAIRNMGQTMNEEEFKNAFNIDLKDTSYSSPKAFADSIAEKVEEYSETIDAVKRKIGPMIDPFIHADNSRNRYVSTLMRKAQEDA